MSLKQISTIVVILCTFFTCANVFAGDASEVNYVSEIHGTLRAKYELEPEYMENRFQVRNARLEVVGNIAPIISYKFNADFCDRGKFKMLDAYAAANLGHGFKVQLGQMRMPFSVDATRAPHIRYFANRSFIGKQVGNVRGVGGKLVYNFKNIPLNIEAGVFNSEGISDHQTWRRSMDYSGKINYKVDNVKFEVGIESIEPDSVRMHLYDASVTWASGRWLVEGEYIYKYYTNDAFEACHAYNFMANYFMPVKMGVFNQLSFHGRFDGMTDHSSGERNSAGFLEIDDNARNRVTIGATLSYILPKVKTDFRVNYENYFYRDGIVAPAGDRDKILVELVVRF